MLQNEDRAAVRRTELQKHKLRVTAVFFVNADRSHLLPIRYIGKSKSPNCFKDPRFRHHSNFYTSQSKGWMDSARFEEWIKWWHDEAHSHNPGPKLLIMDNFGGHNISANIHNVRIITLPSMSRAKHQPLDLGFIGNCKIRYRALLLRSIIKIMEARS